MKRHRQSCSLSRSGHGIAGAGVERLEDRLLFATFTVSNTLDSGPGSLRQAILDANASGGKDTIAFNIGGGGARTIAPISDLPDITDPVVIDGYTQPGASPNTLTSGTSAVLLIELQRGLKITAGSSTVRGLVLGGPGVSGSNGLIELSDAGGNVIEGNHIGFGSADSASNEGILAWRGSDGNTIGGTAPAARNVISGTSAGIRIYGPSNNRIIGNLIGTDPTGTQSRPNGVGVLVQLGGETPKGNIIGGTASGERNVIASNYQYDVWLDGADNTVVQGNLIGTADGTRPLSNGLVVSTPIVVVYGQGNLIGGATPAARNTIIAGAGNDGTTATALLVDGSPGLRVHGNLIGTGQVGLDTVYTYGNGVEVRPGTTDVLIGGSQPGEGNVISHFGGAGVAVLGTSGNRVLGNSVHSNGGIGIDLVAASDGTPANPGTGVVTPNDPSADIGDSDTGPNGLQNYPVITVADASANNGTTVVAGTLNSGVNATYRIEFFANPAADPSGHGEGQTFLGAIDVTTDVSGATAFNTTVPVAVGGQFVTATATNVTASHPDYLSTSEFSAAVQAAGGPVVPRPGNLPAISVAGVSASEGNAGTTALNFAVTLSQPSATPVTVGYATADGTATAGGDYVAANGTLTIPAGQTSAVIVVTVNGDTIAELDEVFTLTLGNPNGAALATAQATGTVVNDDAGDVTPPATGSGDLTPSLSASVPASVIGGQPAKKANAAVNVTNQGTASIAGPITVRLFVSPDQTLDGSEPQVAAVTRTVRLKPGRSAPIRLKVPAFPAVSDGIYFLVARLTGAGGTDRAVTLGTPVTIAAPFVDLAPTAFSAPASAARGKKITLPLTVRNAGNTAANGPLGVRLLASADDVLSADDIDLGVFTTNLRLKANTSNGIRLRTALPAGLSAGSYRLIAVLDANALFAESNENNNAVTSPATTVVA